MKNTLSYFTKKLLLFSSPILLLVLIYIALDPFHIIYTRASYGSSYLKTYNRNKISTDLFLMNKDDQKFDSYIFGSSRSSTFHTSEWGKYLNDNKVFHFDGFCDNISGIEGKMKFIINNGEQIKNALIIIDQDTFSERFDDIESLTHHKDYRWSGENIFKYHLSYFKSFFKKQYFIAYLDAKIFNTFRPYMKDVYQFNYFYTDVQNDFIFLENIKEIKNDSIGYYENDIFKNRNNNPTMLEPLIKKYHLSNLNKVSELLKSQKTNVKVVIAPLFDRKKFNPIDLEILQIYFGAKNIYDFSGKNIYTNSVSNYYEDSHFKPSVGSNILKEIYQKENNNQK